MAEVAYPCRRSLMAATWPRATTWTCYHNAIEVQPSTEGTTLRNGIGRKAVYSAPPPAPGKEYFNGFGETVPASIGGRYLPAVRLSDGDSERCSDRRRPWYAGDRMVCVHPSINAPRH